MPDFEAPKSVLFLCVANSARSQIAEAIARSIAPDDVRILSAGSRPASKVHPLAIRVLSEIGLEIGDQHPKSVDEIDLDEIDLFVTLCAEEICPNLDRKRRQIHLGLPDPAAVDADPDAYLDAFRSTRDELQQRIAAIFS